MSALDVIPVPGHPGKWARRCVVEAWVTAGSPRLNWAGRTKTEQRYLYNLWRQGRGNAADNPDGNTRMPHVRGMALDLAVWDSRTIAAMEHAGFARPITKLRGRPWADGAGGFTQDEPWHFELKKYVGSIRSIPLVDAAPTATDSKPFVPETPATNVEEEEDDMPKNSGVYYERGKNTNTWVYLIFNTGSGWYHEFSNGTGKGKSGGEYNNPIAVALDTPAWAPTTEAHAGVIKRGLERVLSPNTTISGSLSVDVDA